jgi:hypothetical protein
MIITENRLSFEFPDDWIVSKFDDWTFYRQQLAALMNGISALDILALDTEKTLWLIEVKDYRMHSKAHPNDLHDFSDQEELIKLTDKIILKILGTCSTLLPATIYASDQEKTCAAAFLTAKKLCVVLHIEYDRNSIHTSNLSVNLYQKLRKKLKKGAVGREPLIISIHDMQNVAWQVRST